MNVELLIEFIEESEKEDIECFMNIQFNKKKQSITVQTITSEDEDFIKSVSEKFDYIPVSKEPAHDFIPDLFTISFF